MGALTSAPAQGVHRDDVYMPITPMFHVHAWGMPYIATLMGLKQVYPGRYVPDQLLRIIDQEGHLFTLRAHDPSHAAQQPGVGRDGLVPLEGDHRRLGATAGLAKAAVERGIDVFTGYGMSETRLILTLAQVKTSLMSDPAHQLATRAKTGLPVPLVDLRIVDGQMQDQPRDGRSPGEIVVRAPWLTQGYFRNEAASEDLWAGGYLHTNDIGVIDREGYVQVTDRTSDVIKTGGEWVLSLEVESLISRHEAVSEAAASSA